MSAEDCRRPLPQPAREPDRHNVFRDDRVHVCAEMCPTCVFRPGNLMSLRPGRLRGMIDEALASDGCIPCHERLQTAGFTEGDAVCRGFFDRYRTTPLQLAERLDRITEV